MKKFMNIIAIVILVLLVIFVILNIKIVSIKLFFWNVEGSLSIILFIVLLLGIISGYILALPQIFKKRKQIKELRSQIKDKPGMSSENNTEI